MPQLPFVALILAVAMIFANPLAAQSVRVQNGLNEWGYGWMFSYGGNCYVALPEHVAGPLPKVSIYTAAPVVTDQATVQKPFWPGMDLAIAVLDRGELDGRCTANLGDLRPGPQARTAAIGQLLRVTALGEETRAPMRINRRDYLSLGAELTRDTDARIGKGNSGAFLYAGETPIGMALQHDDPSRAEFMRSEEIAMNLTRYLASQGVAFRPSEPEKPSALQDQSDGIVIREVRANVPAILPQHAAENVTGEGLFVSAPNGPLEILLRIDNDTPRPVSRVRITAPPEGYAVPRDITVQTDAGEDAARPRSWTFGQMTTDGRFDTGPLAARNVRWVRILIRSAWGEGPVAIERITLD